MRVTACAEMPLPFLFVTGSLGPVDTTARSSVELGTHGMLQVAKGVSDL
jgi:hypothetical protein